MALNLLQKYQHPYSAQSGKSTEKAEMTKQLGHHEANLPEFFRGYSAAALRPSSASWGLRAAGEEGWGGGWARQLHTSDVFFPVTTAQLSSSTYSLRSGCRGLISDRPLSVCSKRRPVPPVYRFGSCLFKTFPCLFPFPSSSTRANPEEWSQGILRKYLKPIKCGYKFIVILKLIISFLTSSQSLHWASI